MFDLSLKFPKDVYSEMFKTNIRGHNESVYIFLNLDSNNKCSDEFVEGIIYAQAGPTKAYKIYNLKSLKRISLKNHPELGMNGFELHDSKDEKYDITLYCDDGIIFHRWLSYILIYYIKNVMNGSVEQFNCSKFFRIDACYELLLIDKKQYGGYQNDPTQKD